MNFLLRRRALLEGLNPTVAPLYRIDCYPSTQQLLSSALESQLEPLLIQSSNSVDAFLPPIIYHQKRAEQLMKLPLSELTSPMLVQQDIEQLLTGYYGKPRYVNEGDFPLLDAKMKKLAKIPVEHFTISRQDAISIFAYSPFKLQQLQASTSDLITVCQSGDFIDIAAPNATPQKRIKSWEIQGTSSCLFKSLVISAQNITRMHVVGFTSTAEHKRYQDDCKKKEALNHRTLGKEQALFAFDPSSPGSPFFLPHGTRIIQRLMDFLRKEYRESGFDEVITPIIFEKALWVQSGHWQNYKENMFLLREDSSEPESTTNGLKPMNCPGHCLLYSQSSKSYRDLPVRLAEFSPLHRYQTLTRNEASGALTGLTRVRKFHQDDAHIFCTHSQILAEIKATLAFVDRLYHIFGFTYELTLSTRPENYLGDEQEWKDAEEQLVQALNDTTNNFNVNEGDGAFYGPKIDVYIRDALGRRHQTATIQLDFQLPSRFNLEYKDENGGAQTPVIIHRAVLGSVERMFGILIEHYGGKWPFWLSPRQCIVVPIADAHIEYAEKLKGLLKSNRMQFYVDIDKSDNTVSKKIRDAQKMGYNYILVVGDKELQNGTVSVRGREGSIDASGLVREWEMNTDLFQ